LLVAAGRDVAFQSGLQLLQVAEGSFRSGDRILVLAHKRDVVGERVRASFAVSDFKVMGERPRLGVEDGGFLFLVVVGRGEVDFEQGGEGQ